MAQSITGRLILICSALVLIANQAFALVPPLDCNGAHSQNANLAKICQKVVSGPSCQAVPKNEKLTCGSDTSSNNFNPLTFLKECGMAVFDSVTGTLQLVEALLSFVFDQSLSLIKTGEATPGVNRMSGSLKLYLHTEYAKQLKKAQPPFQTAKAMTHMGPAVASLVFKKVEDFVKSTYPFNFECLNRNAQLKKVCNIVAAVAVPPTLLVSFLKFGPKALLGMVKVEKAVATNIIGLRRATDLSSSITVANAEKLLKRPITDKNIRQAIDDAHATGLGQAGQDGGVAKIGNYTEAQLRQKSEILKSAGFSKEERRALIESGTVGQAPSPRVSKLSDEDLKLFEAGNSKPIPAFNLKTSEVLLQLKPTDKIKAEIVDDWGSTAVKELTARELLEAGAKGKVTRVSIKEIAQTKVSVSPLISSKIDSALLKESPQILEAKVEFASGEVGRFFGTRNQLLTLAKEKNVKRAEVWLDSDHSAPGVSSIPITKRNSTFDPIADRYDSIPAEFKTTIKELNLSGTTVYHGTVSNFEEAVKAGPRNIGKGYGGRGLYLAAAGEAELADDYAKLAMKQWKDRANYDGIKVSSGETKPVVLVGKINPDREMTVGVFHIDKDKPTDLSKGILGGSDWSNDAVVRKTLEDKFDILDIRGASKAGVPGLSDRFYVIHERASKDAIIWQNQ